MHNIDMHNKVLLSIQRTDITKSNSTLKFQMSAPDLKGPVPVNKRPIKVDDDSAPLEQGWYGFLNP